MTAGYSARQEALRLSRVSRNAAARADRARRRSDNFAKGALGEEAVADVLRVLVGDQGQVIADRSLPRGGNIDCMLVSQCGVDVIDAKSWEGKVAITNGRLLCDGWTQARHLDRVREQSEYVSVALRSDWAAVPVRPVIALTSPANGLFFAHVSGVDVVGMLNLEALLTRRAIQLDRASGEAIAATLAGAFPPAGSGGSVIPRQSDPKRLTFRPTATSQFERYNRIFYIHEWRNWGKDRLYLMSPEGQTLGWKDLIGGGVEIEHEAGDAGPFVKAILESSSAVGVGLAADALPQVPIDLGGLRLLGRLANMHEMALVGQEWRNGRSYRMYGTLINPDVGTFKIGYVDLRDASLHPSIFGPVGKDHSTAESYLEVLRDRRPQRA
jgi:hypothetical protein